MTKQAGIFADYFSQELAKLTWNDRNFWDAIFVCLKGVESERQEGERGWVLGSWMVGSLNREFVISSHFLWKKVAKEHPQSQTVGLGMAGMDKRRFRLSALLGLIPPYLPRRNRKAPIAESIVRAVRLRRPSRKRSLSLL